ncbi:lipopolysaccharide biosynthesis protein [Caenimonas terrae]|uniref:Lipopolysaccharide biosynthesis protein n=1 Tax=Caenimonas terrae TaxID=696074 RepID=A0ABW0NCK4_9BURK
MNHLAYLRGKITEHRAKSKSFAKSVLSSLMNQAVSSGTNFALTVYLARTLTTADFGLYGIGFAITLLYAGVCDALFLTQMVVHAPEKLPDDRLPYAARMLSALVLFCVLTASLTILLLCLDATSSHLAGQYFALALSIVAASVSFALKDFFIRHAYTVRRENWALWVNIVVAATLAAALAVKYMLFGGFGPAGALWVYALSNLAGAAVGFVIVGLPMASVCMKEIYKDVRHAWVGGRWAFVGVAVTWSQTQLYMYVTAMFVGPAGVGLANAARILVTPAMFLMPAVTQIVMPRLATLRTTNLARMIQMSTIFSAGLVAFAALYSIALISTGDFIAPMLTRHYRYVDVAPLVGAWCVMLVFQFSRIGAVTCLQILKEFRAVTLSNSISLLAAVPIAVILMQMIGVSGAILGGAIGEMVFSVLLYKVVKMKYVALRVHM